MGVRRLGQWVRDHDRVGVVVLAVVVTGLALLVHLTYRLDDVRSPTWWTIALCLLATTPLLLRISRPVTVMVLCLAAQMTIEALRVAGPGWVAVCVAAYSLAAHSSARTVQITVPIFAAIIFGFVLLGWLTNDADWQAIIATQVVFITAALLGDNVRRRRERQEELLERAERAERERELLAERRVIGERTRIAREMHDVVAHSVNVMIIQAAAARRSLDSAPDEAKAMLASLEATGRSAMTEMRQILGVLRSGDGEPDRAPQPTLSMLHELCTADPTMPVSLMVDGEVGELPAGVELSAYRVVQEALTNVRRHAGQVRAVTVRVARVDGSLTVDIDDDGRGSAADRTVRPGFGLRGMQERIGAFGGAVHAGPRVGGGWRVSASIPLPSVFA
jgi:signal transduction histidine kinase